MKKSIFVLAALLAATFANAQITLEHTFNSWVYCPNMHYSGAVTTINGDLFIEKLNSGNHIKVYDAYTYDILADILVPENSSISLISRGFFMQNTSLAYLICEKNNSAIDSSKRCHLYIKSIDGTIISDLGTCYEYEMIYFFKVGSSYKLAIEKLLNEDLTDETTEIYSLPGNGEAQAVSTPSSPKRSARKIAREGQVLVQTDNNTYTLTGAEVK